MTRKEHLSRSHLTWQKLLFFLFCLLKWMTIFKNWLRNPSLPKVTLLVSNLLDWRPKFLSWLILNLTDSSNSWKQVEQSPRLLWLRDKKSEYILFWLQTFNIEKSYSPSAFSTMVKPPSPRIMIFTFKNKKYWLETRI